MIRYETPKQSELVFPTKESTNAIKPPHQINSVRQDESKSGVQKEGAKKKKLLRRTSWQERLLRAAVGAHKADVINDESSKLIKPSMQNSCDEQVS
jgi:hypothetical protein